MASTTKSFNTTLKVSDVKPSTKEYKTVSLKKIITNLVKETEFKIIQDSTKQDNVSGEFFGCGFVRTLVNAYNEHLGLVLDPNQVWVVIVQQFSLYLSKNSEELRDKIIDFKGKNQLEIFSGGTLFTTDFGDLANRMVNEQITKNIKTQDLVDWLLPSFSTTKERHRISGSISIMCALREYFDYKFTLKCGLPSVTLLGNLQDWQKLRKKADKLLEFKIKKDSNIEKWHKMLTSILDQFVLTKQGKGDPKWWNRIVSHHGGGSGPSFISGWASVFTCFSDRGDWQGDRFTVQTVGTYEKSEFPVINTNDISSSFLSVPVLINDRGKEYKSTVMAGNFAMQILKNKNTQTISVTPRVDWCIAIKMS